MKSIQKQKGMTPIGWVIVLLLIAFFALLALTIIPSYIESFSVSGILKDLESDHETATMSPSEISTTIMKRLDINSVNSVTRDDIYIDKTGSGLEITIDYEVRKNLMANIDLVIHFEKTIEVESR